MSLPSDQLPTPPPDESFRVWHRAASEQVTAAAEDDTVDRALALARAREFGQRARAMATTPAQRALTESLLDGVEKVRAALDL